MIHNNLNKQKLLIDRLQGIASALAAKPQSLALIGLGSCGLDVSRLDQYSDLEFFVIVREGSRDQYLGDLSWLQQQAPLVYQFQNTTDGFKALYRDGVFVEFAVFEPHHLSSIPYAPGRIIWAVEDFDPKLTNPQVELPLNQLVNVDWAVNEALSLLYIGISRFMRGEKLSAFRFIQHYAVDRVMELAQVWEQERPFQVDPFVPDRRFEQRFPTTSENFSSIMPGYDETPQAALVILSFLEKHYPVNQAFVNNIRDLLTESLKSD